jgi:hypothetical protein
MALLLKDGSYLKVTKIEEDRGRVFYNTYRNPEIREDEKKEDLSKYEVIIQNSEYAPEVEEELKKLADSSKSVSDNIKVAGYSAFKLLPMFEGAIDC